MLENGWAFSQTVQTFTRNDTAAPALHCHAQMSPCAFRVALSCVPSTSGLRFSIEVTQEVTFMRNTSVSQLHSVCCSEGGKVGETCPSLC